ncbi:MAG TPA: glycosyl hydrolase [Ktedonobacteraceae bacterium]|jgi:photosystem II stability/assembly factor-like uncharacterized protein
MSTLYLAFDTTLVTARRHRGAWRADFHPMESHPQCLAVDQQHPQYVYCGTFDGGLWRSSDAGANWTQAGEGIAFAAVMSVAVSTLEQVNGSGVVYAGTEPSAIFRSEDQGTSWQELTALRALPSAPTWSFPPRPWTSHIRWIAPDPVVAGRIFAAAEAGALLRSLDGGHSWEDRKVGGPFDTHTLALPRSVPGCLYSAAGDGFLHAGDGFARSDDGGETWVRPGEGLDHHYLWSVAVDSADPHTLVISAAAGPQQAHNPQQAESVIYRRSAGSPWCMVQAGLPPARGLLASVLAAGEAGVFYAANNRGVFCSQDAGASWEALPISWPAVSPGRAHALVVVPQA